MSNLPARLHSVYCSLGSIYIVCEKLSVMQEQAWVRRFCAQNLKFTLFLANQEYPPPRIGTSHGGLRKFGSEVGNNSPPPPNENCWGLWIWSYQEWKWKLVKIVQDFGFEVAKSTPPPPEMRWYVATNRCCIPHGYHLVVHLTLPLTYAQCPSIKLYGSGCVVNSSIWYRCCCQITLVSNAICSVRNRNR